MFNGERKSANSHARRAFTVTSGTSGALAIALAVGGCSSSSDNDKSGSTTKNGKSSPSASSAPRQLTAFTLGAAGDLLVHAPVQVNAKKNAGGKGFNFDPMFQKVTPLLSKPDLTLCHLETPLSPDDTDLSGPHQMVFNVPHELANSAKKAGFDGCDFASNHMWDRGLPGLANTKKVLTDAGLKAQVPSATNVSDQAPVFYDVKGMKVAQLAYSYTALNAADPNTKTPEGAPWIGKWMWPIEKADGILADAKRAKAQGADVVVISMHWGGEYVTEATKDQLDLAKKLLDSKDVDAILGTHVHVAQPCQKINGKYVIYGMGNFLSNQSPSVNSSLRPQTQDGMIVDINFTPKDGGFTQSMTYQPTHVNIEAGHVIELATPTQNPDAYKRVVDSVSGLGKSCDAKPAS